MGNKDSLIFLKNVFLFIFMLVISSSVYAGQSILIASPPTSSVMLSAAAIQPLLDAISEETDMDVEYVQYDDWLNYTKDIRKDIYDILVSEAHVASWCLRKSQSGGGLEHQVVQRAKGKRQIVLASNKSYEDLIELNDKNICVRPSPSLDAVQLYRAYSNPVMQPNIKEVRGSYYDLVDSLKSESCDAVVVEEAFVKGGLHTIYKFDLVDRAALTMSKKLPLDIREKIIKALSKEISKRSLKNFIRTFSGEKVKKIVSADRFEYKDYDLLLEQVWGW